MQEFIYVIADNVIILALTQNTELQMGKVTKISTPKSPDSIALITAIEDCINEIATENMTPIEVMGVLELVKIRFFTENLIVD